MVLVELHGLMPLTVAVHMQRTLMNLPPEMSDLSALQTSIFDLVTQNLQHRISKAKSVLIAQLPLSKPANL